MSKRRFVVVHGFNVSDGGKSTTGRLLPFLDGDIQLAQYGWTGVGSVLAFNRNLASIIAGMAAPGAIGIGHSNGCALLVHAAEMGAHFDKLVLINPALDAHYEFPANVREVHVFHNRFDVPVLAARLLNKLLPLPRFYWGAMGNTGHRGKDPRVKNHDLSNYVKGHSAVFESRNLDFFKGWLQAAIEGRKVL